MKATTILIADDSREIRDVVRIMLESEGYRVLEAASGEETLELAQNPNSLVALYILDVMMPGMDGFETCRSLRRFTHAPVLFLTAKSQDSDKADGFSSGGDDYLVKPFSSTELVARVQAILRRYFVYQGKDAEHSDQEDLFLDNVQIRARTNEVLRDGKPVYLTDIEYRILLLMARNRKRIFTAQELYESVWNEPYLYTSNNTVMVHIRNLRKKLEQDPQNPRLIKNIWGKGYRIE
ncbi:MAG: response regulator transcription factor [Oscillospiraceae bacterium]